MSRISSRRRYRPLKLRQSIAQCELLEVRRLLSVTISATSPIRSVPTDAIGVNTAPWDGLLTSASTLTLSEAAGIDTVRLGGGSYVDGTLSGTKVTQTGWDFNQNVYSNTIGQMAEYAASLGATVIVDVNYGTGSPQEAEALWAYLDGSPTDTTPIAGGEEWLANATSWTQNAFPAETVGYWASLRAAAPLQTNDGLNFLRIDHPAPFNFTYFEMGNEVYGTWEADEHGKTGDSLVIPTGDTRKAHDPTTLIAFSNDFETAIDGFLADGMESGASPITIGIDSQDVAESSSDFSDWIGGILNQAVTQKFTLGFIADHYYTPVSPGSENDAELLALSNSNNSTQLGPYYNSTNPYEWSLRADDYDTDINNVIVADGASGEQYLGNVKLIADEVNSVAGTNNMQMTSLVNGLFIADAIGAAYDTTGLDGIGGFQSFSIWDLHNGFSTSTESGIYGWRQGGDYGILGAGGANTGTGSGGTAPIIDNNNETYPDYFSLVLASKVYQAGGTIVSASLDSTNNIDTYAVLESNGDLDLFVINKNYPGADAPNNTPDPTTTEQFNISGFDASSSAQIWEYGVAEDDAQYFSATGAASLTNIAANLAISNGSFSYALPDYSMMVIQLTPQSGPTITQVAAANPSPVTGTTTTLSALGSENGSGSGLNYTWSATSVPNGVLNPTYSVNGNNSASSTIATFYGAGSYTFLVTISDSSNNTTTSSVNVTVQQTPTNINVSPSNSPVVPVGFSQQFAASVTDQFGDTVASPSLTWGITGSGNSISTAGDATLGSTPGSFTVSAQDGSAQGDAAVIAEDFAVPSGSTLDINLGSAGPVTLTASGSNITAGQNGVQITLSGFTAVTVTDTGSADILNFDGPLALPFTFVNTGSSTVNVNAGTLTLAADMGGTISIGNLSVANAASLAMTPATTSSRTTLALNTLSLGTSASLDVANNQILINYGAGPDPINSIAAWITGGYADGSWNGPGIISSTAQSNANYGLGYADAADAGNPADLPADQIKIMYTLLGDANLDGNVNGGDFTIMAAHFNQSVTNGWDEGDFNYDGDVNGADFTLLTENFNQSAQIAAVEIASPAAAVTVVPTNSASITSNSTDSNSNDVTGTVLGKQVKQQKRHGGRG